MNEYFSNFIETIKRTSKHHVTKNFVSSLVHVLGHRCALYADGACSIIPFIRYRYLLKTSYVASNLFPARERWHMSYMNSLSPIYLVSSDIDLVTRQPTCLTQVTVEIRLESYHERVVFVAIVTASAQLAHCGRGLISFLDLQTRHVNLRNKYKRSILFQKLRQRL